MFLIDTSKPTYLLSIILYVHILTDRLRLIDYFYFYVQIPTRCLEKVDKYPEHSRWLKSLTISKIVGNIVNLQHPMNLSFSSISSVMKFIYYTQISVAVTKKLL